MFSSNHNHSPIQIERVVQQIEHKFGHHSVRRASDIHTPQQYIPTGFRGLDAMMQGVPQGYVSLFQGMPTSGVHTLGHHLIVQAQHKHMGVLYVDMTATLDGESARQHGVHLDDLALVESDDPTLIVSLIRAVLHLNVLGLLVVHLRSDVTHLNLRPLLTLLHASGCALVVVATHPIESDSTALHLQVQREKWLRRGDDIIGCLSHVAIVQHRWGKAGQEVRLLLPLEAEAWR